MYNLNYTFLTELEVDTRQSFDDVSDDLLLLDNDEESLVVNMNNIISSWQNYFWTKSNSNNPNKERLDITFTDLLIERNSSDSSKDWQGNPLNKDEMMTVQELNTAFNRISWSGGKNWSTLTEDLCNAITLLQKQYVEKNNIYPSKSVLVTDTSPNKLGFGKWHKKSNCYLSEKFDSNNYNIPSGYSENGSIDSIGLTPNADNPPSHSHKLEYTPVSGGGGGESSGTCSGGGATPAFQYFNKRSGLSEPGNHGKDAMWFSGSWVGNYNRAAMVVKTDSSLGLPRVHGHETAEFTVSKTKKDPVDSKIKVAPKTYPLSASVWEKE